MTEIVASNVDVSRCFNLRGVRMLPCTGPVALVMQRRDAEARMFENSRYSSSRKVRGSFADVVQATRSALAAEGFGVLTEIDVKATLAKKLDVTVRPYIILGACNPALAHRALQLDPAIGTLLPCNVVVAEDESGGVEVATIDPRTMFSVVGNPDVGPIADDVRARLERVLDGLAS